MKIDEYMSAEKFPLTTQNGLAPSSQLLFDANRMDMAKEMIENGKTFDDEEKAILAELEEKMKHHSRLTQELAEEEERNRDPADVKLQAERRAKSADALRRLSGK